MLTVKHTNTTFYFNQERTDSIFGCERSRVRLPDRPYLISFKILIKMIILNNNLLAVSPRHQRSSLGFCKCSQLNFHMMRQHKSPHGKHSLFQVVGMNGKFTRYFCCFVNPLTIFNSFYLVVGGRWKMTYSTINGILFLLLKFVHFGLLVH